MQKRIIRKSSNNNSSSATQRLILPGDTETNLGPVNHDNQQTKPKSDCLCQPVNYAPRQYE